jgi:hypothetical protein
MISKKMKMLLHGTPTSQFSRPDTAARAVPDPHALPVLLFAALLTLVRTRAQATVQFADVSGAADAVVS